MKTLPNLALILMFSLSATAALAQVKTYKMEPVPHDAYDPGKIDYDIQFNEGMVKRDPEGAIAWAMLSGAYLARSRESDSDVFAWKAEEAARNSLKFRRKGNANAAAKLVNALLEQHRFQDALVASEDVLKIEPGSGEGLRLKADCLVEIGRYDEALAILDSLPRQDEDTSAMAIRAHIMGSKGDHKTEIALLQKALSIVELNSSIPQTALGWFNTKMATAYEQMGDLDTAQRLYAVAWKQNPRSYKVTLGMARVALAKKDYKAVETWGKRTLPIAYSLDAYALMGDAAMARGDQKLATKNYEQCRTMFRDEVANFDKLGKGGPFSVRPIDRQFSTFAANHNLYLDEAIVAAQRDAKNRPDGRAWDNLGWIQWQMGDRANATENLRRAVASGMVDPMINQHASMANVNP